MKRILITLIFVCITALSYAQSSKVTLTVIDAATQEGIAGAVVAVAPAAEPDNEDKTKYYTSGFGGDTSITGLKRGEYKLKISWNYVGFCCSVAQLCPHSLRPHGL